VCQVGYVESECLEGKRVNVNEAMKNNRRIWFGGW
jgi:hypothetical protein